MSGIKLFRQQYPVHLYGFSKPTLLGTAAHKRKIQRLYRYALRIGTETVKGSSLFAGSGTSGFFRWRTYRHATRGISRDAFVQKFIRDQFEMCLDMTDQIEVDDMIKEVVDEISQYEHSRPKLKAHESGGVAWQRTGYNTHKPRDLRHMGLAIQRFSHDEAAHF